MKIKLYRKIIRPIIRYAHDEYPSLPYINYWYNDDEIIKMGIEEKFNKHTDGMSHLEWEERFVECGEFEKEVGYTDD